MFSTTISNQLVTHTANANVTLDDLGAAMLGWFEHPEFDPDKPVMWDLRSASFDLSSDTLREWSVKTAAVTNRYRAGRKTALVLPSQESANTAVDLLGSHDWQNKVRIYQNDYEAALAWLTTAIH